jgi:hypothetical protein
MTEQNLKTEPSNNTKPVLCEVVTFSEQYESYQKIADNYAIKFASWYLSTKFDSSGKYLNKTDLELIEIFKRDIFHNLT